MIATEVEGSACWAARVLRAGGGEGWRGLEGPACGAASLGTQGSSDVASSSLVTNAFEESVCVAPFCRAALGRAALGGAGLGAAGLGAAGLDGTGFEGPASGGGAALCAFCARLWLVRFAVITASWGRGRVKTTKGQNKGDTSET